MNTIPAGSLVPRSVVPPSIVGYRVLRRLGGGPRSTVYLALPTPDTADAAESVALVVFNATADARSISREIAALTGALSGQVPRLIDVATLPDGRAVLIEERVTSESVGAMLRDCRFISAGEAVSIIAPAIAALAAVHACGLVHTSLSLGTLALTHSGRPVLMGLGSLAELPPAGGQADPEASRQHGLDAIRADYDRLTALMREVFGHLDNERELHRRSEPIAAWFEMATTAIPFRPCLGELEQRLFDWAPGAPLRLLQTPRTDMLHDPAATVRAGAGAGAGAGDATRADAWWGGLGSVFSDLVPQSDGRQRHQPSWLVTHTHAWAARLRARRRPLIVAGALVTAITVLVLTLVPSGTGSGAATGSDIAPIAGSTEHADADAIMADDPTAATSALLRRRDQCVQELSLECLATVVQADSALWAADSYSIRQSQQNDGHSELLQLADRELTVSQRTGNAAIIALAPSAGVPESQPASLLVIRGEAGWRLRELFD